MYATCHYLFKKLDHHTLANFTTEPPLTYVPLIAHPSWTSFLATLIFDYRSQFKLLSNSTEKISYALRQRPKVELKYWLPDGHRICARTYSREFKIKGHKHASYQPIFFTFLPFFCISDCFWHNLRNFLFNFRRPAPGDGHSPQREVYIYTIKTIWPWHITMPRDIRRLGPVESIINNSVARL